MVVPKAFTHQGEFAAAVAEVERELDSRIVRIRYTLGEDWTGDPAVFFRIVLPDEATRRDQLLTNANYISTTIVQRIEPLEQWGVLPYFTFRSQSEQTQMNEPAWA